MLVSAVWQSESAIHITYIPIWDLNLDLKFAECRECSPTLPSRSLFSVNFIYVESFIKISQRAVSPAIKKHKAKRKWNARTIKLYIRGPFKAEHFKMREKSCGWSIQNISYNGKLFYNLVKNEKGPLLIVESLLLGMITCIPVL